ncbi:hypothetical protein D3C76_1432180 [compost metagenome]
MLRQTFLPMPLHLRKTLDQKLLPAAFLHRIVDPSSALLVLTDQGSSIRIHPILHRYAMAEKRVDPSDVMYFALDEKHDRYDSDHL